MAPKIGPSQFSTVAPTTRETPANNDERNPEVLNAAKLYETQFLREMVRAMRKASPEGDHELVPKSMAEKIFSEQLDDKYVDDWVDNGGVGFADVIYKQMMETYFRAPEAPMRGPIPTNKPVESKPISVTEKDMTLQLKVKNGEKAEITAPWKGQVLMSRPLEHGMQSLLLDHGDGLKSSLVFKGSLLAPEGSEVGAGQRLGLLSPENPSVLWKIQR
jgi:Rod binding domain-containing protein